MLSELLGLVQENAVGTWIELYGWKVGSLLLFCLPLFLFSSSHFGCLQVGPDNLVTVSSQEEIIKTRNITEKIDIESVASIMASCY